MFKRVTIVALVVAAFVLVMAVPALAFNGYRSDYTTTDYCSICHQEGQPGSAPKIYDRWAETAHAHAGADGQGARLPYGSSCGGCHTSNYAPSKVVPTPTRTATTPSPVPTATNVSWGAVIPSPFPAQADGDVHYSEAFVGCSSCHYGAATGTAPQYGNDVNDTAHMAPYANLADAQICGQCHSRYSYAVTPVPVATVPYVKLDGAGNPIPNPSPTSLLQPQYAMGYKMLGEPTSWIPAGLSSVLNVQSPGWTPTPNPSATSVLGLQAYWQIDGVDTVWQYRGHDGAANQYPDWMTEGHADALTDLKAVMGPNPPARCLECHSTDYRIAVESGKTPPTGAQSQFGITCVGCHTPHDAGTAKGEWSEEFTPQLRTDSQDTLCIECHNGELPENGSASPGAEVHHPMKEMIEGYGAIDVAGFPSVHKDKCVQCHMPPTTTSPTGGNHTFKIIEPEVASEARVNPALLASPSPTPRMPYSSCSGAKGCHTRNVGPTGTYDPYALYLQDTIEQRQAWTHTQIDNVWAALDVAAGNLGYDNTDAARDALVAKPQAEWTTAERAFLSSFTNVEFVQSEGSFGLHNWDYSRMVVDKAMEQAKIAQTGVIVRLPWAVTLQLSRTSVNAGTTVKFSGNVKTAKGVAGSGTVRIMRRVNGVWTVWLKGNLNSSGNYSISQKLTRKGTFRVRAFMPADSLNLSAYSSNITLTVR